MRRRRLALALAALLLVPSTAAAAGWRPLGPPDFAITEYRPLVADARSDHTLDRETWTLHGATFELDAVGRAHGDSKYEYRVRVHQVGGDGARMRPLAARMACGTVGESTDMASYMGGDGVLVVGVDFQPTRRHFPATPCELDVTFATYLEVGAGVWRTGERVASFRFTVAAA